MNREQAIEAVAPIIERMESRRPETEIAAAVVDALRVPVLDEEWERRERAIVATGEGYDYWIRLYRGVYEAAQAALAEQDDDPENLRRLRDALRNERRCPDDGACHHECGSGPCWRVSTCVPLSASGWEDWPEEVKRQHRDVVGIYRTALERIRDYEENFGSPPLDDEFRRIAREALG